MILVRTLGFAAVLTAALGATGCVGDASMATSDQATSHPLPTATPPPDHSAFIAAVDSLAADALQQGPIAGLSIAVFQADTAILAKGYGFADLEAGAPASADTSYPIASVSKNFTAALVLRLADQGRLALDDPLSRFFPEARPKIGALTLRHLLDHTSGLTRGGPAPRTAAQSVLRRGGTAHVQGETWDYSNYNYSLLGLAIEQVTGRDYASYVRDELTAPLKLSGTGYCEDGTPVPGRARDYLSTHRRVSLTPYWTKAHFFAGGGLCSTVVDLVRWTRALEDGRVISPAMLQVMRSPTRLPGALDADYGLGTRIGSTAGHRKVGHTGGGQGNKAVLARYPDEDLTVVVLLNTERANATITANGIEERVARLFFASPEAVPEGAAPEPDSRRYAGEYRSGSQLVRFAENAGVLTVLSGARRLPGARYLARGAGVFVEADDPSVELRFQLRNEQVDGYRRYRNGWFAGVAVRSETPRPVSAAPVSQRPFSAYARRGPVADGRTGNGRLQRAVSYWQNGGTRTMAEPDSLPAERDRLAAPRPRTDWRRLADGLLLIGLGVFVLLNTTGHLPWTFWYDALTLWPILIVTAGLRIAVDRTRFAWLMILGPIVVLATLAGVAGGRLDNAPGPWQPVAAERPSDTGRLTLHTALASSRLDVTARPMADATILEGRQGSRASKARVETKVEGGDATVTLVPGDQGWEFVRPGRLSRWELAVPEALPLRIDVDGAMIGARFDLRGGRVLGATFDGVFLGVDLHLPKPTERVKLEIHGVFNMVDLFVPPGTPVRVHGPGFPFNLVDRGTGDPKDPATPGYDVEFAGVFSRIGVNPEAMN